MQQSLISRGLHAAGRLFLKLAGKVVIRRVRRQSAVFDAATLDPRQTQETLLKRILSHHAGTDFGREHRSGRVPFRARDENSAVGRPSMSG